MKRSALIILPALAALAMAALLVVVLHPRVNGVRATAHDARAVSQDIATKRRQDLPETPSASSCPDTDAHIDALLDTLEAPGADGWDSFDVGQKIALRCPPEVIAARLSRAGTETNPRVVQAIVVAATLRSDGVECDAATLLPQLLMVYEQTEDLFVRLSVLEGLLRCDAVDAMLCHVEDVLLRCESAAVGMRVGGLLELALERHPEKEVEITRLWVAYAESEAITVSQFCWVVEYLADLDPTALRALRPAQRLQENGFARVCLERAVESSGRRR